MLQPPVNFQTSGKSFNFAAQAQDRDESWDELKDMSSDELQGWFFNYDILVVAALELS
jgi:hypothetical protein